MFGGALQPMHLILILVIALVIFGPGKLPELGSSIGKTIKEFRQSMTEISAPSDASESTAKSEAKPAEAKVGGGEPATKTGGAEPPAKG